MKFKPSFQKRYEPLTDLKELEEAITSPEQKSIRVNTLKISIPKFKSKIKNLTPVPWCKEGFYIKKTSIPIGKLKEHFLGYFYVQEPSSMIPPLILNPKKKDLVLDLAAAPGSKTTQLAALMKNQGIIIANDIKWERIKALSVNLQRLGAVNTLITIYPGHKFPEIKFDKILLDAPCSGTGTLKKSPKTLDIYNPGMIKKLSYTQKKLILKAYSLLKPQGTLVYSTCSLEPEENEGVLDYLLKKTDAKLLPTSLKNLKSSSPILKFENKTYSKEIKKSLRIWPQDNNTEGFFISKITKP